MKNIFRISGIILLIFLIQSCKMKENNEPKIEHGSVIDYDGNTYNTAKIGTQWWMTENLKVIHYRDGSAIENITDSSVWAYLTTGTYCWYNNNEATYKANYGALYNWYTVVDNRNLCPSGWHVPSNDEWVILGDYLGGSLGAEQKMATGEIGFQPVLGGWRSYVCFSVPPCLIFEYLSKRGFWWSSTEKVIYLDPLTVDKSEALCVDLIILPNYAAFEYGETGPSSKSMGFSVRCLKDN
jgi:uncharacterized protein (TIGR02145 family)